MEEIAGVRQLTEDLAAQLERATKALEAREKQLAKEREQLEREKQKMAAFVCSATDLVEINVGGKVMATDRGTLLLAKGSLLEAIFSGRWEESLKRDEAGRVFLDYSPALFEAVLSFLRAARDAKPGEEVASLVVPPKYKAEYEAMVRCLDLREFLDSASPPTTALAFSQSTGGTCDGSIHCDGGVLCSGTSAHFRSAVGRAKLLDDDGSRPRAAWKVTVNTLTIGHWVCAGIIGHGSPGDESRTEPTCWAWAGLNQVWLAGQCRENYGGWRGWAQRDVAIFQLSSSEGLRMFLRRTQQVYRLAGISTDVMKESRVLFSFYNAGTGVEVSPVTAEELTEAGF